jgi:hypothetical protein
MTTNYKAKYKNCSDDKILDEWSSQTQPNSELSQQLLEIMQFRAAMAQKRAAVAAERYTCLTFWLLLATSVGVLISLITALCK